MKFAKIIIIQIMGYIEKETYFQNYQFHEKQVVE